MGEFYAAPRTPQPELCDGIKRNLHLRRRGFAAEGKQCGMAAAHFTKIEGLKPHANSWAAEQWWASPEKQPLNSLLRPLLPCLMCCFELFLQHELRRYKTPF